MTDNKKINTTKHRNREKYRPCKFTYECFGVACEHYWDCDLRGVTKRGNKRGE